MTEQELRVLLLEDDPRDAEILTAQLRRDGYRPNIRRVWTRSAYLEALADPPDVILADYTMPSFDAVAALEILVGKELDVPFIVVTGSVGEERAVACMRAGATDYLLKDRLARLGPAIAAALDQRKARAAKRAAERELARLNRRLEAENSYLQEEIKSRHDFERILGNSQAIRDVLERVQVVAATDATVLVCGETGTGKELFARAIHAGSRRGGRPLVKVNCAALSATLIETELFGHTRGAFTGAVSRSVGRFELADGGTLFLDEIGDLPLPAQAKLLRVLQEGEMERVGESQSIKVNVRVIAATNRELSAAVNEGSFRADLFYRLNVFPITLPPLRDRKGDVAVLTRFFVNQFARKHGKELTPPDELELDVLAAYHWPGNVRELENMVERAVITAGGGTIELSGLLPDARPSPRPATALPAPANVSLDELQSLHIRRVLEATGGRIEGAGGAAELLDINPNTLRSRMKRLGIERPG